MSKTMKLGVAVRGRGANYIYIYIFKKQTKKPKTFSEVLGVRYALESLWRHPWQQNFEKLSRNNLLQLTLTSLINSIHNNLI